MSLTIDNTKLLLLAAGAVVGLLIVKKNFNVTDVAADATAGAVGVIGDAFGGIVVGVGDVLGVPRVDKTECEKAMREGRTWDAGLKCNLPTFWNYLWN